jgi:hypothetical protein
MHVNGPVDLQAPANRSDGSTIMRTESEVQSKVKSLMAGEPPAKRSHRCEVLF